MRSIKFTVFRIASFGGDEMRPGYVRYIQGFQPSIPTGTTFIDMTIEVGAHT